ncbi:two-component system response regulator NarL [Thiohalocapsa halophila]|uniref:Two-component system response regulator NarL n=1 Tax=Thiohalocapsa halophila TaxID=69359 RepID=A0ABS1CD89_9GAMM|nr:response regulator [Thiohalocapsa halophila]MBK1629871.1 two-component system response regulator NarL [Thiohalocapsa halophila]
MRVLLIDDHALFRVGLLELLERRGIEVVDAVGDSDVGLRLTRDCAPDVVLLDLRMPGPGGLEILKQIRAEGLDRRVAMLTTSTEEEDLIASLQAGANGYLLKDMEPDELGAALENIVAGKTVVAPDLTGVLARALRPEPEPAAAPQPAVSELTPREQEILCHLAAGQSNKAIARELGISDGTVKLHVKAILRKLAVHSRVEAAVMAVEQGLCARD